LVAELKETIQSGQRFKRVCFGYLPNTWREKDTDASRRNTVSKGQLLAYLNPVPAEEFDSDTDTYGRDDHQEQREKVKKRRVVDREDLHPLISGSPTHV
jgi:hypothetical protein